jgi:hypothetical protein
MFVGVDPTTHAPNGRIYTASLPPSGSSSFVSFDPNIPGSSNVNGSGIANLSVEIPEGDYYVGFVYPTYGGENLTAGSPVFHHSYYTTCTDHFTGKLDTYRAPYFFQVFSSCSTWQCVNKSSNGNPPSKTNGGYRVIPIINIPGLVGGFGPGQAPGVLSW